MVTYTKKYDCSGKICESDVFASYAAALNDAIFIQTIVDVKTMTILKDSEGFDHPLNAGKFFIYRIIK
jgi:hypothetical protein